MSVNNPDDARHVQDIQSIQRRRLYELEKQAATAGITVEPRILLEIEDLRNTLGILDRVQRSGDDWSAGQVELVLFIATAANQERWARIDRQMEGFKEEVQSLISSMRLLLLIDAALIVVVSIAILQTWGK